MIRYEPRNLSRSPDEGNSLTRLPASGNKRRLSAVRRICVIQRRALIFESRAMNARICFKSSRARGNHRILLILFLCLEFTKDVFVRQEDSLVRFGDGQFQLSADFESVQNFVPSDIVG